MLRAITLGCIGLAFSFGIGLGAQILAPPFAVASELSQIEARGQLIVAVKENLFPLGFRDDAGNLAGFEIDIARGLAEAILGDPNAVELRPVNNLDRVNLVIDGEVDIAIATVTITPQRQRIASFSDPYYLDGTGFMTRLPSIQALEDLRLSRVAVLNQSSAVSHVQYYLPGARLVGVGSYASALALLASGDVDAFAGDITILAGWSQQDSRYRVLSEVISVEPLAVVMPKGSQYSDLRRVVNQTLAQWYESGWLQERALYWGLPWPESSLLTP
jgi:polar amino acid transport system substrate-binding protein